MSLSLLSTPVRRLVVFVAAWLQLSPGISALSQETPPPPAEAAPTGAPDAPPAPTESSLAPTSPPGEAPAEDTTPAPSLSNSPPADLGDAIPQAYAESRYTAIWARNPFQSKTPAGPVGPTLNPLQDDWNLSSVTSVGSTYTIRIRNNKDNTSRKLTTTPDKDGFKIVQVNANRDRKLVSAKIARGEEQAEIKYPETVLASSGGGGAPPTGVVNPVTGRVNGQPNTPKMNGQPNPATSYGGRVIQPGMAPNGAPNMPGNNPAQQRRTLTGPGGVPIQQAPNANPNTFSRPTAAPGFNNAPTAPPTPVQRRRVLIPQAIPTPDTPAQ